MGYELIDHTGDLGIRVWAEDLAAIFCEAARALFDIITDLNRITVKLVREVTVTGRDREELLVAWLNELLYLHEVEGLLFRDFAVNRIDESNMEGVAKGEPMQQNEHVIKTGIKAVTYHQLELSHKGKQWQARIVLDI